MWKQYDPLCQSQQYKAEKSRISIFNPLTKSRKQSPPTQKWGKGEGGTTKILFTVAFLIFCSFESTTKCVLWW